ncbi:hypothetical protein OHB06_51255 [Streptomyces sp. NBC_01604]
MVDDISHEGLRILLPGGVSFQRVKTWNASRDLDYAAKKSRVEHLHAIAGGQVIPGEGEPEVVLCLDEFGPLNLQPHPGWQCAARGGPRKDPDRAPRPRRRATYTRPHGVCGTCSPRTTSPRTSRVGDHVAVLIRGQKADDFRKGERTREEITDLLAGGEAMTHLEAELAEMELQAQTDA